MNFQYAAARNNLYPQHSQGKGRMQPTKNIVPWTFEHVMALLLIMRCCNNINCSMIFNETPHELSEQKYGRSILIKTSNVDFF
jgi:hypothetical protein